MTTIPIGKPVDYYMNFDHYLYDIEWEVKQQIDKDYQIGNSDPDKPRARLFHMIQDTIDPIGIVEIKNDKGYQFYLYNIAKDEIFTFKVLADEDFGFYIEEN